MPETGACDCGSAGASGHNAQSANTGPARATTNRSQSHHEPSGRTILPRDAVVLDFGGEVGGYFSDTTRTVVVGEEPAGFTEVYNLVQEAQDAAVQAVRPGVAAQEVDRVARRIIDRAGYGERFIHRTGHGIGLEVHEPPYIIEGNETILTRRT